MPLLHVYIDITIDGERLRWMPINYTASRDEVQEFDIQKSDDGNDTTFTQIPIDSITTIQDFLIRAIDEAVGIRIEGGESGTTAIEISENGFVIAVGISEASTQFTINNNSGSVARIRGLGAGT